MLGARGRTSHRRHLRAVPPLLRRAVGRRRATAPRWARCAACCTRCAALLEGRRDPRRRRHRPRHRVVPQRSVARLQDRRRHRPGPVGPVPAARGGTRGLRPHGLADGRVRGRRRAGLRGRQGRARPACRAPCSSARPTRTWRSACAARRVVQVRPRAQGDARRSRRRREVRRAAGVDPRLPGARGRLAPTAIRACAAGAPSRQRRCWRASVTSTRFPTTTGTGESTWRAPARSPRPCGATATRPGSSARWPTLRTDVPVFESVDDLAWSGPTPAFDAVRARLESRAERPGAGPASR